jgi:hypothetical protein
MAKQNQVYNHEFATNKQHLINNNTNQHSTQNTTVIMTPPESGTPPTTTDQYHHKETIWRILIDIISLIICKK